MYLDRMEVWSFPDPYRDTETSMIKLEMLLDFITHKRKQAGSLNIRSLSVDVT